MGRDESHRLDEVGEAVVPDGETGDLPDGRGFPPLSRHPGLGRLPGHTHDRQEVAREDIRRMSL
jgi:hypothetical protein